MEGAKAPGHEAAAERPPPNHASADREADTRPPASAPAARHGWPLDTPGVLRLQASIGNHAVGRLLRSRAAGAAVGVHRAPRSVQRVKSADEITTLVTNAARAEGTTEQEVRTVLEFMNTGNRVANLLEGHTVHFRRLPGGNDEKNCHHFAFGGLKGNDALFNVAALGHSLGAEMTFAQYQAQHGNDDEAYDADMYAAVGPLNDFAILEGHEVDVSAALHLADASAQYNLRLYDEMAHSSRQMDGLWWHKFVNFPFVVAVEGAENLHYNAVSANLAVVAPVADTVSAGRFTLP